MYELLDFNSDNSYFGILAHSYLCKLCAGGAKVQLAGLNYLFKKAIGENINS
jgi:hypothetical protein